MKSILKTTSILLISILLLSSCIKETEPTAVATPDQIESNPESLRATIMGICSALHTSYFKKYDDQPNDFGYEAMCQVRDIYCQDMPLINDDGWDWFSSWAKNRYIGENYLNTQIIWNYYWALVKASNDALQAINAETATPVQQQYIGIAKCFRALAYLDLGRMWEFKKNKYTSAPELEGLTVQIVTPGLSQEESRNNPRVKKSVLCDFILADLKDALTYLEGYEPSAKNLPTKSVVYGLQARTYMWMEEYDKAKTAAQSALDAGAFVPLNGEQWSNTMTGFNSADNASWMWADMISSNDPTLTQGGGACSWMSWCSNEATFGYSGFAEGGLRAADRSFYERMSDADFRKWSFLAPKESPLRAKTIFCPSTSKKKIETYRDYICVKFRPGQGNVNSPTVAGAVSFPLMRCEEMYFIIAECDAHKGSAASLVSFMQKYRYEGYACSKTGDALIEEVIFQKRAELWGEGLVYFDIKRLNMGVTRGYKGTNHVQTVTYNTDGLSPWMNQCAVQSEHFQNQAFINNPDPGVESLKTWIDPDAGK